MSIPLIGSYQVSVTGPTHDRLNGNKNGLRDWWCGGGPDRGWLFEVLHDGHPIGQTTLVERGGFREFSDSKIAEIGFNFVEEKYRGQGIFSALIERVDGHAWTMGFDTVFVTPNSLSEKQYLKSGYAIANHRGSQLVLLDPDDAPIEDRQMIATELSGAKYVATVKDYDRLLVTDEERLSWRFSKPDADFRFFHITTGEQDIYVAARPGGPGPLSVNVLSEAFVDGRKMPVDTAVRMADVIGRKLNRNLPLIYQTEHPTEYRAPRAKFYRWFPMAIKSRNGASVPNPSLASYQFTDSDYG